MMQAENELIRLPPLSKGFRDDAVYLHPLVLVLDDLLHDAKEQSSHVVLWII